MISLRRTDSPTDRESCPVGQRPAAGFRSSRAGDVRPPTPPPPAPSPWVWYTPNMLAVSLFITSGTEFNRCSGGLARGRNSGWPGRAHPTGLRLPKQTEGANPGGGSPPPWPTVFPC